MKSHVGIIGLGIMGGAMAEALIAAGYRVSGYDVHPAPRRRLKKAGGRFLSSCAKVASSVDVVISSLPSVAALNEVVQEIAV
jgi:3-hydroxyisobutyrate dehydrogenase-like beta-hydroxyacid dehydrogenase